MNNSILTEEELAFGRKCLAAALAKGVAKARVTLSKTEMDLIGILNSEVDKVTHCLDRSVTVCIFIGGRYGSYSTNRLEESELDAFLDKAIATTLMLEKDPCRDLPSPERTEKEAVSGFELDLYDSTYETLSAEKKREIALGAAIFEKTREAGESGWEIVSEEGEYSDSVYDTYIIDSQGTECRQTETAFEFGVETTVRDSRGDKYSGYWWDASTRLEDLKIGECCPKALQKAVEQIGAKRHRSGKFTMVVSADAASRVVSPILNALNAYSIQQHNSFLEGSLGEKKFPEGLTVIERSRAKGESGARMFDSEGVATIEGPVIEKGVVKSYFVNTYMAAKTGLEPTVEEPIRPKVLPYPREGLTRDDILRLCGEGILVTDFNGGNSNSATGDFSYGIEGFAFKHGRITHPVREMLVTGNFLTLWQGLIAAGDDSRVCMSKQIPTLAFSNVDFSA